MIIMVALINKSASDTMFKCL